LIRRPIKSWKNPALGPTKLTCKQRHKLNHVHTGPGRAWVEKPLPNQLRHVRAVTVKKGDWLGVKEELQHSFKIPYFDRLGRNSGCTLYTATLTQQDYIATLIATVSRRLLSWTRSHSKLKRKEQAYAETLMCRASTLYVLTKNSYLLDRILVLTKDFRKHKKIIHGIIFGFARKLDVNKGFIYSQACSHAHWLTTRASRPRDKSSPNLHSFPFKEVGISNFSERKLWIYDALFRVSSDVRYLGSNYFSTLRPSYDYV